jgi:hypothetical protein
MRSAAGRTQHDLHTVTAAGGRHRRDRRLVSRPASQATRVPPVRLLAHAAGVIAARDAAYGHPAVSMAAIAARWSLTLGRPVTPAQVVLCMLDLKLARLAHDSKHQDSIADVIGYAALLPQVTP